jgi:hypothetical protein
MAGRPNIGSPPNTSSTVKAGWANAVSVRKLRRVGQSNQHVRSTAFLEALSGTAVRRGGQKSERRWCTARESSARTAAVGPLALSPLRHDRGKVRPAYKAHSRWKIGVRTSARVQRGEATTSPDRSMHQRAAHGRGAVHRLRVGASSGRRRAPRGAPPASVTPSQPPDIIGLGPASPVDEAGRRMWNGATAS